MVDKICNPMIDVNVYKKGENNNTRDQNLGVSKFIVLGGVNVREIRTWTPY